MTERSWRPSPPRWISFLRERSQEQAVSLLLRYTALLAVTVALFSTAFHVLMRLEGQQHPWWTGLYWSVSTMTTLGLGDLAFEGFAGRALTSLAVLVGVMFMLVLLPLVLIQFPPWIEARTAARVRRQLGADVSGHVVLTEMDPIGAELMRKLKRFGVPYVLVVSDLEQALRFDALGFSVMLGELDLPETWRAARLQSAALLVANGTDIRNPNVIFTARGVAPELNVVALVRRPEFAGALEAAGCTHMLQVGPTLGRALASRVIGSDALTHEIGSFHDLVIAEATASKTPLVGKTLRESRLTELVEVGVVGTWERGEFLVAGPDTRIGPHTLLILAGTREQMAEYDQLFAIYNVSSEPVLIIGGGVVGRATARALERRGIDYRILDRDAVVLRDQRGIQGDAADVEVLERAGIGRAPAAVVTTHDDDTNVFLTLYCRRLRPEMQLVSRATYERNVETLHRAGADSVVSMASMGSNAILGLLQREEVLTVSEGLEVFKAVVPATLVGGTIGEGDLWRTTGCSVVALRSDGVTHVLPPPERGLAAGDELVLIGSRVDEQRFLERFGA